MRCMVRNKVRFFYALYEGKQPIKDEWGNMTGEYETVYGKPTECYANISPAVGETAARQFGENVDYDKVVVMDNSAPPIDEYSELWVDTMPQLDADGNLLLDADGMEITPHDYDVKKVARSLNSVSYAIHKVIVS